MTRAQDSPAATVVLSKLLGEVPCPLPQAPGLFHPAFRLRSKSFSGKSSPLTHVPVCPAQLECDLRGQDTRVSSRQRGMAETRGLCWALRELAVEFGSARAGLYPAAAYLTGSCLDFLA